MTGQQNTTAAGHDSGAPAATQGYGEAELQELHAVLHEILGEIIRVCGVLHIPYFINGGTVIGAKFFEDILPWDDDIDLGMRREHYERFLREAPAVLGKDYFLQWYGTDPNTPFYFAKVRKNGTLFLEEVCRNISMHQGIYVDIFPYDKVPDNRLLRSLQRKAAVMLNTCFVCKEVWPYRHFGHCGISRPWRENRARVLLKRIIVTLFSKRRIFAWFQRVETLCDKGGSRYYGLLLIRNELIPAADIDHTRPVRLGPRTVQAMADMDTYLLLHYGHVEKYPPAEKRVSHRPMKLSFHTS